MIETGAISIRLETRTNFAMAQTFYTSIGYRQPINQDDIVVTAYEGVNIVGIVRLAFEENTVVLRGMMVAPSHQRSGIGSKMLQELQKHLGQSECFCLPHRWLEKFYGQIGFKPIADEAAPTHLQVRVKEGRAKYPQLIVMKRPGEILKC